jgi:hypothetical protein
MYLLPQTGYCTLDPKAVNVSGVSGLFPVNVERKNESRRLILQGKSHPGHHQKHQIHRRTVLSSATSKGDEAWFSGN